MSYLSILLFTKKQQDHLLNLIYENQQILSLHSEDLGFCGKLAHAIPRTTNKPIYMPHRTIPQQLQGEVHKCLDMGLHQGMIRPSKSPFASQMVIVCKKTSEIHLCVDYWKLNSIVVKDSFPLVWVDEALQVIDNCQLFTLFYLVQSYLQIPVTETDTKKMAFKAGSSGFYAFTHMVRV